VPLALGFVVLLGVGHARAQQAEAPPADQAQAEAAPPVDPADPTEITVLGQRPEPSRSVGLSRQEVRELPGAFGDPFRAVEALPGVTPIVTGLPFFFIRGAPPGNAGYYLDGVRVPLLFHVGVGPSVVHPALIERVDLYPGGYPARFGRFTGGIVAGETAPPSLELKGEYNVRAFDAGAMVEAPFDEGRGAVLLAGRYSFTALLLSLLSPEASLDYWDYQMRAGYDVTPRDRLGVFAFGSYDYAAQDTATEQLTLFETQFHRVDMRYDRVLPKGKMRTAFTLGRDSSTVQQNRDVQLNMAGARTEIEHYVSDELLLRGGTDLLFERYEVDLGTTDLNPSAQRVARLFASRSDVAVGVRGDMVLAVGPRLTITPGLRVDLFGQQGISAWSLDPRLATRAQITPRWALLSTFGVAHQTPSFVVPVPGITPASLDQGLQRALQESFGVEWNVQEGTIATATVFQSVFLDMTDPLGAFEPTLNGCPPGLFPEETLAGDRGGGQTDGMGGGGFNSNFCGLRFLPGTLGPDRSGGGGQGADSNAARRAADAFMVRTMGRAFGIELLVKRKLTRKLGGFFAYTLSRSTRTYNGRSYVATFDRTHVGNLAIAYDLGRGIRVGARGTAYSGLPRATETGVNGRLPAFFRLDLRAEKRWRLGKTSWISAVAEMMNATLSKEAIATSCSLRGCEAQMFGPIFIPSLGVEGGF
jgi:hypothetical protein